MKTNFIQPLSLLFLLLATVNARSNTIEGTITDVRTGDHLIGANVVLDGTMLGAASDENGYYLITNVPIGNYTVRAMFIGYESIEKEVRVEADNAYIIDIALKPSAIELQETKVTAEKRKEKITSAPASMEIVTSRDIRGKNTTNMGAYLKGLKGIDFTSSGINNYSISIRGFNSSFNTRLLTLSDGRVANIPALRVINYSTIPQSMDDVDKIEVILGPATALYGANAHSGVVNILSKPPSQSEGFSMSLSGSNDERQLRKINGRFAKKLTNSFSIKVSGLYLHAYDWPFISEEEYKTHLYPWSQAPYRTRDGKDNNPGQGALLIKKMNDQGDSVRIGNGEAMNTFDPDGDGVMGEDWFNGYDDDGDGLIDEDYFIADGIDNDGDCPGDTNHDGCYCCRGDTNVDEEIDMSSDINNDGVDNDNNGTVDDEDEYFWGAAIENNILIAWGRRDTLINDEINPYYVPNLPWYNYGQDLRGNQRYNEDEVVLEFDIFTYDFGPDGLPGDPFIDKGGNGIYDKGEALNFLGGWSDLGLDGIKAIDLNGDGVYDQAGEIAPDFGEGDGFWQPGDAWVDGNNNGVIDQITCLGELDLLGNCNFGYGTPDSYNYSISKDNFSDHDVYPFPNGIWDEGEKINDWGHDGFPDTGDPGEKNGEWAMDGFSGDPFDDKNGNDQYDPNEEDFTDLNNNGKYDHPTGEFDGIFDTGDGLYAFIGEPFVDCGYDPDGNSLCSTSDDWRDEYGNGIKDLNETYTDTNNDGLYNAPDLIDNYQFINDTDGDGLSDYPDFEIDNRKVEFRIDYDPNSDFNMTLQTGYSWTKTQQVTGTGRYIADGFEYKFYQLRSRYKNWFTQYYMNESFSGNTRGYLLGNRIIDKSKNYAIQIQNNFDFKLINTNFVWGMDYFRTDPKTFGTILNDGPNGYDNDGDDVYIKNDDIDNDGDGMVDDKICPDGVGEGFRFGKYWHCTEGIDEPDEFVDPRSDEYGIYYQSTTELFGTSRYELITAARLDYHDLLDEGVLFAPKLGFLYKPDSKSSMRFTYGKAHNTPKFDQFISTAEKMMERRDKTMSDKEKILLTDLYEKLI